MTDEICKCQGKGWYYKKIREHGKRVQVVAVCKACKRKPLPEKKS